jgi:hypothetical protein
MLREGKNLVAADAAAAPPVKGQGRAPRQVGAKRCGRTTMVDLSHA